MKLILHVDGASRGNPGPAAVGVVLTDETGQTLSAFGECIGETTNNVAEYRALLRGLEEAIKHGAGEVAVYGDSQLVVRQMNGEYQVRHPNLQPLHEEAKRLVRSLERVSFVYVPRKHNSRADKLAGSALDKEAKCPPQK